MAEAARKIEEPVVHHDAGTEPSRLLRQLAAQASYGTQTVLAGTADLALWDRLQTVIEAEAAQATPDDVAGRIVTLAWQARDRLRTADPTGAAQERYLRLTSDMERWLEAWQPVAAPDVLAREVYATLLWHTAWHLLASGDRMATVLRMLSGVRAQPAHELQPSTDAGTGLAARIGRGIRFAADITTGTWRAYRAAQAAQEARARRRASAAMARQPSIPAGAIRLDGRRLHRSIIPTWLALVALSWVSLLWGALISAPFGIGFGILASAVVGVFAVPLWGTVFGFLGMGSARDSTLSQMGFREALDGHSLKAPAKTFARQLGIRTPRIGTVPVANAFAMGTDRHDATIAIGKPLMSKLTPDEVAAVIGHELGHVVSGDTQRMMLMRTFQNAGVWFMVFQGWKQFARWIICWAAELYILAFSRHREYWADAIGAALTSKEAMIGALRTLAKEGQALTSDERRHARFMFRGAFSTHPSTAQRIRALEQETYIRRLPLKGIG